MLSSEGVVHILDTDDAWLCPQLHAISGNLGFVVAKVIASDLNWLSAALSSLFLVVGLWLI